VSEPAPGQTGCAHAWKVIVPATTQTALRRPSPVIASRVLAKPLHPEDGVPSTDLRARHGSGDRLPVEEDAVEAVEVATTTGAIEILALRRFLHPEHDRIPDDRTRLDVQGRQASKPAERGDAALDVQRAEDAVGDVAVAIEIVVRPVSTVAPLRNQERAH